MSIALPAITSARVFVGLSGGVDSSVSAALLQAAGYDVTGVFIRVWQPDFFECTWKDDRLDAMRVCAKLGIPFRELDLEEEYKKEVVDYMIREYKAGKTPNPDVMCNRFIKFGGFYNWARENGADFIATGHYARIQSRKSQTLSAESLTLTVGADENKDQSYFLWQIRREQLPHILFPVGGMKKTEVRRLAKKFGLITADKKDSQGLCFVGKVDMKGFLARFITPKRGRILLRAGVRGLGRGLTPIGEHDGAFFYTIGERLGVLPRSNLRSGERVDLERAKPLYVVAKDMEKNTLTVSHKNPTGELPQGKREATIKDCNWLIEPRAGKTYTVRTRYRQPLQSCRLAITNDRLLLLNASLKVEFEEPQTVAAGQSLVLYDGGVVVGGGIIG